MNDYQDGFEDGQDAYKRGFRCDVTRRQEGPARDRQEDFDHGHYDGWHAAAQADHEDRGGAFDQPERLVWIYTWGERLLVTTGGRQRTAVVVEGGETPTIKFIDNGERGPIPAGATVSSGAMLGCEGW